MARLALYLLGPPRLELDGEPVHIDRRKALALLAYLTVATPQRKGQGHSRDALATLLWPEYDQRRARANLRDTLSRLNRGLGAEWLAADRETIALNPDTELWMDVDQFRQRLVACKTHGHPTTEACPDCVPPLEEAVDLYRDHFLAGFTLRDSPNFDEFQRLQTDELDDQLAGALVRLANYHASQGSFERALEHARRVLALKPLHEPAHRHLMVLYTKSGQRAAALRQYQTCRQLMAEELGLEPERETMALYEQIKAGEIPHRAAPPPHNLPAPSTRFIGRQAELAQISERLQDSACRLLTLVGPGGSGKTRLALQAAAAQPDRFEHGVYFVPLAPLQLADDIVPTVAQVLGFSFSSIHLGGSGATPRQQLLDYLRQKRMLLVLDNFEHLLPPSPSPAGESDGGGIELVDEILEAAPGIKIITTSRAGLRMRSEHLCPVAGLGLPPIPTPDDGRWAAVCPEPGRKSVIQSDAVRLFLTAARRVRPDFQLRDEDLADVVQVCRLVEGMPLAILLAAAWAGMLTPAEIAAQMCGEIGQGLDFLATDLHGVPERQRSVRATLDHSWNLLTERQREVFQALSVFRGGFSREAAQDVTGASLHELKGLVDRSLVSWAPALSPSPGAGGRYGIHELLRQYAEEKLARSPDGGATARDRHCAHYTAALQRWGEELKGPRQHAAYDAMGVEIENARAAWDWAAARGQATRLDQAIDAMWDHHYRRGLLQDGEVAFRTAAEKLAALEPLGPDGWRVLARILGWQANFIADGGDVERARPLLAQSMALLDRPELADHDVRSERAFILMLQGEREEDSDRERGRRLLRQSLALFRALDDRWWAAYVLFSLGTLADTLDECRRLREEGLAIMQALGDQRHMAMFSGFMALTAVGQGEMEQAERLARRMVAIQREYGAAPFDIEDAVHILGYTLVRRGKFSEGWELLRESIAISDDRGDRLSSASRMQIAWAELHLGRYAQARACLGPDVVREIDRQRAIGYLFLTLGSVALAEGEYAEAHRSLQKSVAVYRETQEDGDLAHALSILGYAARGLGQLSQAQQHLFEALQIASRVGAFIPTVHALPAVALLLADRGEVERAVELYALASHYPLVANSRWFEDIAEKHIAAVAATLPPEVVAAAQERGQARDLDATVAELLEELAE